MKGKEIGGARFWPEKGAEAGVEFCGTYVGLIDYKYQGQNKKAALFDVEGQGVQVSGGQMLKYYCDVEHEGKNALIFPGKKYWVTFKGKKDLKNGQQPANQYAVCPDE